MRCAKVSFVSAALLATLLNAGAALAQGQGCTGRNLLDDLKATDATAHDAVKKQSADLANGGARLWKVEHENARGASYLTATIPVTDERVQRLSPALIEALSSVRRVAVDIAHVEARRLQEGLTTLHGSGKLVLADGSTLASHLTPAEQQATVKVLARSGLPAELATRAQPWAAMALLATSECEWKRIRTGRLSMTGYIASLAESRGLGTVDLETVESQFEAAAGMPQPAQVSLLKGRLASAAAQDDFNETLVQMYLTKDLAAVWPLQAELAKKAGVEEAALEAYQTHVVAERAKRLGNRLHQHLQGGGVMVAVDHMMMFGPSGVVAMVKDMGFTVTAIE